VRLAQRGLRNLDNGPETVENEALKKQLRKQAKTVLRQSQISAALLTLVALALPQPRKQK
jgi:transposase-like protein